MPRIARRGENRDTLARLARHPIKGERERDAMKEKKPRLPDAGYMPEEYLQSVQDALAAGIPGYYARVAKKILRIQDEEWMRSALADHVRNTAGVGVALTVEAAEQVAKFLTVPPKKNAGGQFKSSFGKALQMCQVAALIEHCGMKPSAACDLVAAGWSDDPNKPLDPSGLRRKLGKREDFWRAAAIDSMGYFFFRPTGDPDVERLSFSAETVDRMLKAARPDIHPVKRIRAFFHLPDCK